jgi:hypothetical protein
MIVATSTPQSEEKTHPVISPERLAKLERIAELARTISLAAYQHTGSPLYNLKHLCIDLDCIDAR